MARQVFALQGAVILLVGVAVTALAVLDARADGRAAATGRVLAVATTMAAQPTVARALAGPDPPAVLQPLAEDVRVRSGTDFVVVMAPDRTRYSHPTASLIGRPFIGNIGPALAGGTVVETYTGTLGPSVRTVVPVRDADGVVVGLVSVGITTRRIGDVLLTALPAVLGAAAAAMVVAGAGTALVTRRLRRQTRGLDAEELSRAVEYFDAVLHGVREGMVLTDPGGRLQLVNDAARELLGAREVPPGTPVGALGAPASISALIADGRRATDELHLSADRVLVVDQRPAVFDGRRLGSVLTVRDRTDLEALTGELRSVQGFADSLRAQAHEAANTLHTVVTLIELGRDEEAVQLATAELELSQRLTDQLLAAVDEPALAALLLGKAALAAERGVELVVTPDSALGAERVPVRDLVTVLGNLVDNALDAAVAGEPPRRIAVTLREDGAGLLLRVADSGTGLGQADVDAAFRWGWSTKPADAPAGRGLGLALVGQVVRRHAGTVEVDPGPGAVFTVRLHPEGAGR